MADKTKQRARAIQKSTGMSYQAALNTTGGPRGPGRFERILQRAIVLADEWRRKDDEEFEALKAANPGKSALELLWKPLPDDWLLKELLPSPAEQALMDHLETLTYEDAINVIALMYCGRDHADFVTERTNAFGTFPTTELVAHHMATKAPLAEYLRKGIVEVRRQGLDLEGL